MSLRVTRLTKSQLNNQKKPEEDHHTHQHTHWQHNFHTHHTDGRKGKDVLKLQALTWRHSMHNHTKNHKKCKHLWSSYHTPKLGDNFQHTKTQTNIIWKEHLHAHRDHRHNTHILWKTIHGLSNWAPPTTHNYITFNNKITCTPKHIVNCFTKQFTNTVKHTIQTDPLTG